ncbi:MAG TPA: shikimate dehydrogenase [Flavisolibacter sp.]|nr:shikimate dehydrogenase [Flavisolibacter sp.]
MRRFGLIGKTLKHSFSKKYFTQKFRDNNITNCTYESFELQSIDLLPQLIEDHPDLEGLNVTIPYKEQVLPFLSNADHIVSAIGACNCIKIEGKKLFGFNTDVVGFKNSLQPKLGVQHTKALILGTGGAAKAVEYTLKELNINYLIVSRKQSPHTVNYTSIDDTLISDYKLIINTTPLGMYPDVGTYPDIPYKTISSEHLLFDLVYNPEKTVFLKKGEEQGAQIVNGLEMLVLQAEESWRIWNSDL